MRFLAVRSRVLGSRVEPLMMRSGGRGCGGGWRGSAGGGGANAVSTGSVRMTTSTSSMDVTLTSANDAGSPSRKTSPSRNTGGARGGETVVAAALKSQKQRGDVILGDGSAQVQLTSDYVKKHVPKPTEIRTLLLQAVRGNVLFGALGEGEVQDLVDAMEPRSVSAGTVVISQGDPGDNFYVIESGLVSWSHLTPLSVARCSNACLTRTNAEPRTQLTRAQRALPCSSKSS